MYIFYIILYNIMCIYIDIYYIICIYIYRDAALIVAAGSDSYTYMYMFMAISICIPISCEEGTPRLAFCGPYTDWEL